MECKSFALVLVLLGSFSAFVTGNCPCEDEALCEPIARPPGKEFFMFSVKPNVWRKYDWTKVTTIALFRPRDDELMCEAHKRGVRIILKAEFPKEQLGNKDARTKWIKNLTDEALAWHADGVNIDFESPIAKGSKEVALLTTLVNETATAFRADNKHAQVSFDVPWSPNCTYGRCYDAEALSKILDFLVIMAYDMNSQKCMANSPINQTRYGVKEYIALGMKPEKLVLGLPWYGYDYPCTELIGNICKHAEGTQRGYADIQDLITSRAMYGPAWDQDSASFFFNYEDSVGGKHQVWYDNPQSLKQKYEIAAMADLTGVAVWHTDLLDYSDIPRAKQQTKDMWDALLN